MISLITRYIMSRVSAPRSTDTHGFNTFGDYYAQTYVRAQPYIYGILIGYVLFKMRGKKLDIHWVG